MVDLIRIQTMVRQGKYRVKSHAVRHMFEEGFDEAQCVEALLNGSVLEEYLEEDRCLVVGTFHWRANTRSHLHVICDYSQTDRVELVTAYIPGPPEWISPRWRG